MIKTNFKLWLKNSKDKPHVKFTWLFSIWALSKCRYTYYHFLFSTSRDIQYRGPKIAAHNLAAKRKTKFTSLRLIWIRAASSEPLVVSALQCYNLWSANCPAIKSKPCRSLCLVVFLVPPSLTGEHYDFVSTAYKDPPNRLSR